MPSERKLDVAAVKSLVVAGWTGRNVAALEAHIKELEAIGVKRPKTVPIFYRVARSLLTSGDTIEVMADKSSGEVEFVLYQFDDGLWFGVGSDHTDRKAETVGVTLSKQLCAKPVGTQLWRYDEVKPHWEKLVLRSWADGKLYQEGPVTAMRAPEDLLSRHGQIPSGWAMFCGTLAAKGGIRPADVFRIELDDPVRKRKLAHEYRIHVLPVEG